MKSAPLIQSQDRIVNQLQQNILQALRPILQNPLVGGRLMEGVALATGDNVLNHGLDRKLQGWIPVLISAGVTLYDKQASNQNPELTLVINSSGTATVTLYVF